MTSLPSHWSSLKTIEKKLQMKWDKGIFLLELTEPGELFPLRVPLKGPDSTELSEQFSIARIWTQQFTDTAEKPFSVERKEFNHRLLGKNKIPVAILFNSLPDLARFLGKLHVLKLFKNLQQELLDPFPQLKPWLVKNTITALELAPVWRKLIQVALWMSNHPQPGIYVRQMSIPDIDTKFVEKNRKVLTEWFDMILHPSKIDNSVTGVKNFEQRFGFISKPAQVRFRFLDKNHYLNGLSDLMVRTDEFCALSPDVDTIFVTENDINGLAFPSVNNAIILFGRGYGFDFLKDAEWLQDKKIYYWGDIDTHGFAILNQFRAIFSQTRSMFMDRETLLLHKNQWVQETYPTKAVLNRLTDEELELYNDLLNNRYGDSIRLEQEVLSFDLLKEFLSDENSSS
jgi:hypothetical protein